MKPGELVEIKRQSIGVPAGTIALITDTVYTDPDPGHSIIRYHIVRLFSTDSSGQNILRERRYLESDLEVVSANR